MARVTELSFQDDTLESLIGCDQTAWQPYSSYSSYSTVRAFVILPLLEHPLIVLVGQSSSAGLGTQTFPLSGQSFLAINLLFLID